MKKNTRAIRYRNGHYLIRLKKSGLHMAILLIMLWLTWNQRHDIYDFYDGFFTALGS